MSAINYQLDSQGRVVDQHGRVLVGLDGAAIQVAGLSTTMATTKAERMSSDSSSTRASSTTSSFRHKAGETRSICTPGVKPGTVMRPKAPQDWAMDFPLGTIKEGANAGSFWYCGELKHGCTGALTKRWWLLSDEVKDATGDVKKLEKVAWELIERKRASGSLDGARGEFLSRAEDSARLAALDVAPSVTCHQDREARKVAQRKQKRRQAKSQAAAASCKKHVKKGCAKTL